MPKELIYNRYHGQFASDHSQCEVNADGEHPDGDCAGKPVALDSSAIKVGWSKEGLEHVEIAVVRNSDYETDVQAWHSQMNRSGLNRLIKVLRQARDDAFGRDE